MSTVAVVGLGGMGSRMARRLLAAGHDVVVWNRTAAKASPLVELGATAAPSPADGARRAEVVITMVANPAALRAVTEGPNGVAAGLGGSTLIEMSTVGPDAIARLASAVPVLLDAPVVGSLAEAEAGTLAIFVGGDAALVARWTALLSILGSPVHVGSLGSGAAAKLVANSALVGVAGVLGEALALARGLGLSQEAAFDVLTATPLAAQAERRRPSIEAGDYPPRFPLALARKDADLIAKAAADAGLELRLTAAARQWLAEADDAGWGDKDYSAVLAWIGREAAGVEFDRFSIALLMLRDDAPELDEEAAATLQDAHLTHLAELHQAGHLLAAGPLLDDAYRGLCVFNVEPEQARTLSEQDPAVRAGRFSITVLPWMVPGGAVSFAPTRFPRSVAEAQGS